MYKPTNTIDNMKITVGDSQEGMYIIIGWNRSGHTTFTSLTIDQTKKLLRLLKETLSGLK